MLVRCLERGGVSLLRGLPMLSIFKDKAQGELSCRKGKDAL
jgi:hypothetical protein